MKQISGRELAQVIHGVVGHWLEFTVATTFLQWLADANIVTPMHGNQPLKKGLLRSLMKIAGLQEDDL